MAIEKELEKCFGIGFTISNDVNKSGLPRYLVSGMIDIKSNMAGRG